MLLFLESHRHVLQGTGGVADDKGVGVRQQRLERRVHVLRHQQHRPLTVVAQVLKAADSKGKRLRVVDVVQARDERCSGILGLQEGNLGGGGARVDRIRHQVAEHEQRRLCKSSSRTAGERGAGEVGMRAKVGEGSPETQQGR